jgi:phosphate/sulfate permease
VLGAGLARGHGINWLLVLIILCSWLLTVPAAAFMSLSLYKLVSFALTLG